MRQGDSRRLKYYILDISVALVLHRGKLKFSRAEAAVIDLVNEADHASVAGAKQGELRLASIVSNRLKVTSALLFWNQAKV